MIGLIPAGGYGTRLKEAAKGKPKGLIEINGVPIVAHNIRKMVELPGLTRVVIVTNNRFFRDYEDWRKEQDFGVPLEVINDQTNNNEERLGQVGDMLYAIREAQMDDDLLMVSSDNLFRESLAPVLEKFKETGKTVNLLKERTNPALLRQLGVVKVDDDMRFIEFQEKPAQPNSTLSSTGVILFPHHVLPLMFQYAQEGNNPDKVGHFLEWLMKKEAIYGTLVNDEWFDIGTKEVLEEARRKMG